MAQFLNGRLATLRSSISRRLQSKILATYSIAGNKMTIQWANGQKTTSDLEPDKTCFLWDMGTFCPVEQFPAGTRLEGVFSGGASAGYGKTANATTLTLSKDGKYKLEQAGSAHSEVSAGTQLYGGSSESGTRRVIVWTVLEMHWNKLRWDSPSSCQSGKVS